jgi:hypothetical protein
MLGDLFAVEMDGHPVTVVCDANPVNDHGLLSKVENTHRPEHNSTMPGTANTSKKRMRSSLSIAASELNSQKKVAAITMVIGAIG